MFRCCTSSTLIRFIAVILEVTGAETGEGSELTQSTVHSKDYNVEVYPCVAGLGHAPRPEVKQFRSGYDVMNSNVQD